MLISSLFFGLFALKYSVYMYEIMDAKEEKIVKNAHKCQRMIGGGSHDYKSNTS